jgi:hypothetical protein
MHLMPTRDLCCHSRAIAVPQPVQQRQTSPAATPQPAVKNISAACCTQLLADPSLLPEDLERALLSLPLPAPQYT